jgi:cytochrome P450
MTAVRCPVRTDYNPFDEATLADPYPRLARLREEAPVFFSPVIGMWVVTRFEDVKEVLRHPEVFSSEGVLMGTFSDPVAALLDGKVPMSATLIGMDRPDHTRLRRIVNAAFTPDRVARMEQDMRDLARQLIAALPDGAFDPVKDLSYPMALTVITRLIGVPDADRDRCHDWAWAGNELLAANDRGEPLERQLEYAQALLDYHEYIASLIAERAERPADDLISAVWEVRRRGDVELTDFEMLSLFPGLLTAGHETTAHLIGSALWHLLEAPERWQALCQDPTKAEEIVEEALRYDSSVYGMPRKALTAASLGGAEIPAGDLVYVVYASANRDVAEFPQPDAFDPTRAKGSSHLAFGRGAHFCVGAPLARLESRILLEELSTAMPTLVLVEPPTHPPHFIFRMLDGLQVSAAG